jgi:hypothetical protein
MVGLGVGVGEGDAVGVAEGAGVGLGPTLPPERKTVPPRSTAIGAAPAMTNLSGVDTVRAPQ